MKPELKKALSKFKKPVVFKNGYIGDGKLMAMPICEVFVSNRLTKRQQAIIGNEIAAHLNNIMEEGE